MSKKEQVNYYAIIPATIRYDNQLKATEKLLYGEITALSNKNGYCYAQNKYFAELYNVTVVTVSRWLSHLKELGYIKMEIIRNEKKQITARNIYIVDTPYYQKRQYPYIQKNQEGINKNVKENNININIDDDIFYLIINNSKKVPKKFLEIIEQLEFNYKQNMLNAMQKDKVSMLRDIVSILYSLYNSKFRNILIKINRNELINLYIISQEHMPNNFLSYYRKSIINKYTH